MRKSGLFAVIVIVFLGMFSVSCGSNPDEASEKQEKPVAAVSVEEKDLVIYSEMTAQIEPAMEVKVVPKLSGKVEDVKVQIGERVERGQVLVTLESREIKAQVQQAEAALISARNAAASARSQIEQTRANYENAKADYDRIKTLFEQGAVSQQDLEGAELQYTVARTNFEASQQQLEKTPGGYQALEAGVKQAEASLELAKAQLDSTVITSPIAGVVASRYIDSGEMAAPGSPVITVVDMDTVLARANITERHINRLEEGQEVDIRVNSASEATFRGEVTTLGLVAGESNTYLLEVEIPNDTLVLKPGMSAVIMAAMEKVEDAVVVPIDAVVERGGKDVVFVYDNGKALERQVVTGLKDNEMIEIKSGLTTQDLVVTAGQHMLNDGDSVTLQDGGVVK